MQEVKVTRRTRKIGWAINASPTQKINRFGEGYLVVESPDKPEFEGTIKQVFDYVDKDSFYNSIKNSGTYYTTAFFVNGKQIDTDTTAWQYQVDELLNKERDSVILAVF